MSKSDASDVVVGRKAARLLCELLRGSDGEEDDDPAICIGEVEKQKL